MSDEIIGLAVLQPTWVKDIFRLWFRARKADGSSAQTCIFIRDEARNDLPERFPGWDDPNSNSIWKFHRNGTRLECHPSVNWISFGFHNTFNWSVEYVEMAEAEPSPDDGGLVARKLADMLNESVPVGRWAWFIMISI
jgi:hypothetical protein